MEQKLSLTQLISIDTLQQLQDAFALMTETGAVIIDSDGNQLTKSSNFNRFCTKQMEHNPEKCRKCIVDGGIRAILENRSCTYQCHAGLIVFAAPIAVNGKNFGAFIGGQVFLSPPDMEFFEKMADDLGVNREKLTSDVKKIKLVNDEHISKTVTCISVIAGILSDLAYNGYALHMNNIELEKAVKAKADFLANMSHEIRTPMNAVLGMAEMALREEMSPEAREYLHQIRFSGRNLLVIINDILDFSKIESGKMDIVSVTYEPLSMINDLASIICNRIGDKDVEFILDISPDLPNKLFGDNVRIQQILVNLLNNAVKFTRQGRVRLKLGCEFEADDIVILKATVSDTGSGIKKDDLSKLFKSFQQVDSKRNRNIEGMGLGLAISKQLLELMGGSISVESEYEKGSDFHFMLPQKLVGARTPPIKLEHPISAALLIENPYVRAQVEKDLGRIGVKFTDVEKAPSLTDGRYDYFIVERVFYSEKLKSYFAENEKCTCIIIDEFDSMKEPELQGMRVIRKPVYFLNLYAEMGIINKYVRESASADNEFSFTAPDARILIVDDNAINLTVAKGLVAPLKVNVDTAESAAETIERIKETKYDIIFMDHMMPDVDGIETTHIIRRLISSYADVPIIALTANALEGTRDMFIREGMNDFVAKPIDTKDITAKIRKWLPQEKIIPTDKPEETLSENGGASLDISELDTESAIQLLGSESLFRTVLREYYTSIDKKAGIIEEYFNNCRWKEYTIEVHSLKSTSRQIGAAELADLAAELENAGKEGNLGMINERTGLLLEKYRRLKKILAPYFPECLADKVLKTAEPLEIIQMLEALDEALGEFDSLMIDDVIEKMSEYKFDEVSERFYMRLKDAADINDIDECSAISNEWRDDIINIYIESR